MLRPEHLIDPLAKDLLAATALEHRIDGELRRQCHHEHRRAVIDVTREPARAVRIVRGRYQEAGWKIEERIIDRHHYGIDRIELVFTTENETAC